MAAQHCKCTWFHWIVLLKTVKWQISCYEYFTIIKNYIVQNLTKVGWESGGNPPPKKKNKQRLIQEWVDVLDYWRIQTEMKWGSGKLSNVEMISKKNRQIHRRKKITNEKLCRSRNDISGWNPHIF
jgi:hypothetical protein